MAVTSGAHIVVADLSSAVTLTPPEENIHFLRFQILTQNVRMTFSNTTPTASVGFQIVASAETRDLELEYGQTVNFIEETPSAELQYQWMVEV